MKVTDAGKGFHVLDGANLKQRQWLEANLVTEVRLEGDRVFFKPTPATTDFFESLTGIEYLAKVEGAVQINRDYKFTHLKKPFDHQAEVLPRIREKGNFGLLWEVGLGKSKTGLDIATERFIDGKINAILVVTLKGVHRKWIDVDAKENLCVPYEGRAWPISPTKQDKLLQHNGLIVASVNFDAAWRGTCLKFVKRLLTTRKTMLIIDESHEVSNPDASRTDALLKMRKYARYRMIMTGTVMPNNPLNLWSQMLLVDENIWGGMNYWQFRNRYAVIKEMPGVTYQKFNKKTGQMEDKPVKTVVAYKNIEEMNRIIAPWISRLDKSVLKLKDPIYAPQYFDLSEDQKRAYNELIKVKMTEYKGQPMTPNASLTLRIRLDQITHGFFKTDDGEFIRFKENPRLETFANWVEQVPANRKGIIWVPFTESVLDVEKFLTERKESFRTYVGLSEKRPEQTDDYHARCVHEFQNNRDLRWIIGSTAMATGITLTAGTETFYYGNFTSLRHRLQSEGRNHRIGQDEVVTYVDSIANGTKDKERVESFKHKMEMAAIIQGDELRSWLI